MSLIKTRLSFTLAKSTYLFNLNFFFRGIVREYLRAAVWRFSIILIFFLWGLQKICICINLESKIGKKKRNQYIASDIP